MEAAATPAARECSHIPCIFHFLELPRPFAYPSIARGLVLTWESSQSSELRRAEKLDRDHELWSGATRPIQMSTSETTAMSGNGGDDITAERA